MANDSGVFPPYWSPTVEEEQEQDKKLKEQEAAKRLLKNLEKRRNKREPKD